VDALIRAGLGFHGVNLGFRLKKVKGHRKLIFWSPRVFVFDLTDLLHFVWGKYVDPLD
jgi:hypothetical protein